MTAVWIVAIVCVMIVLIVFMTLRFERRGELNVELHPDVLAHRIKELRERRDYLESPQRGWRQQGKIDRVDRELSLLCTIQASQERRP